MANNRNDQYGQNQTKSSPGRNDDGTFNSNDRSQSASSRSGAAWDNDADKNRQGNQTGRQQNDTGRQGSKNDR